MFVQFQINIYSAHEVFIFRRSYEISVCREVNDSIEFSNFSA